MYGSIALAIKTGPGGSRRPIPWVARLIALDNKYIFVRHFMRGVRDYSRAKRETRLGIWVYFALAPGFYEVYEPVNHRYDKRYFIQVNDNGSIDQITKEEITEWLKTTQNTGLG